MSSDALARATAIALALATFGATPSARAQACCASSGAVTPARLGLHEDALVGVRVRAGEVIGGYAPDGGFSMQPPHTSELDFEEDVFGAVRVTARSQLSLLIPVLETSKAAPGIRAIGGGVGDVNVGGRYDFVLARESRVVPGIALLAGITVPTGQSPMAATAPLAVDATGVGALQGNVGIAVEQKWGPWLVNVTGLVAARAPQSSQGIHETLGTQLRGIGAVVYTFRNAMAAGLVASYAAEGDATINGADDPESAKRGLTLSGIGVYPVTDALRVQGGVFVMPPISEVGANQPASTGLTLTMLVGFM
jgi:hypothetical protein